MGLGDAVCLNGPQPDHGAAAPLSAVWAPALRADSMLLWAAFFFSLVSVYAAFNWLPTLLAESGLRWRRPLKVWRRSTWAAVTALLGAR
jgi:AAHS family 4-hydroxybenzoate transporter-like MFS transporter